MAISNADGELRLEGVSSGYGTLEVVHNVSLSVRAGEIVAMIGPNGAGKSTVLRTIFGFLRPTQGTIWLSGVPLHHLRPPQVLRKGIAYVMQGYNVLPNLTVEDNLILGAYIRSDPGVRADVEHLYERFPALYARRRQKARVLSGVERRMLELARVLLIHPAVLLLY
jgi:branched-chain amino acid transport system ATP-binding protein